jgi:hypothetical protein
MTVVLRGIIKTEVLGAVVPKEKTESFLQEILLVLSE